jgi:hypothetical protein
MLSDQEQQAWDDIQRCWADEAQEPRHARQAAAVLRQPPPRDLDEAPLMMIGGIWAALFLALFGATVTGLVVAAAAALGLVLWRYWPLLSGGGESPAPGH